MGWLDVVPSAEASQEKPKTDLVGWESSPDDVKAQREASEGWSAQFWDWFASSDKAQPPTHSTPTSRDKPVVDEPGLGDDLIRLLASFSTPEDQARLTARPTEPEPADRLIKAVVNTAAEREDASHTLLAIKNLIDKYWL